MTDAPVRTIRAATENDLEAILALYAETGLDDGELMDIARARRIFQRLASYPDYRIYVVTEADGTISASYALLIMDNIAHNGRPLSIVEQVAVSASQQGTGLGTMMMHHAMECSRALGCYKLGLSSNVKFERAHAFYDKLGFVRHGFSFHVDLAPEGVAAPADSAEGPG
ncbi:MAG: GNAT family N-acetyltransferase [Hyphomicrobiaceae bacterium]|nr:GNAT family N-acetyltransferase [Hyphomicrobiaceae bacterium]